MSIIEHLRELRVRLIRAVIALTVGFIVAYFFSDPLFALLTCRFGKSRTASCC